MSRPECLEGRKWLAKWVENEPFRTVSCIKSIAEGFSARERTSPGEERFDGEIRDAFVESDGGGIRGENWEIDVTLRQKQQRSVFAYNKE